MIYYPKPMHKQRAFCGSYCISRVSGNRNAVPDRSILAHASVYGRKRYYFRCREYQRVFYKIKFSISPKPRTICGLITRNFADQPGLSHFTKPSYLEPCLQSSLIDSHTETTLWLFYLCLTSHSIPPNHSLNRLPHPSPAHLQSGRWTFLSEA